MQIPGKKKRAILSEFLLDNAHENQHETQKKTASTCKRQAEFTTA